jgi:hypothetical protein
MQSRRKFVFAGSAVSLAALVFPEGLFAGSAQPSRGQFSLEDLSWEAFARQLNSTFWIHATRARSIPVELEEVRVRPDKPLKPGQRPAGDAGNERFSLFFSGNRSQRLPQDTYTFEHEALGRFDFFIVPLLTRKPHKISYEIVFNRPRQGGIAPKQIEARRDVQVYGAPDAAKPPSHNQTTG